MKSSLRNFLINIYGYSFFNKLLLLTPVYAVFMQRNGISDMQLSILFILLSVGTFCTQIPVTWITNKFGPKKAIILGQFLEGCGFLLWLLYPTFWGFALGMFMWGTMNAFFNVAFEGMIYDELRARHHHNMYARVLGRRYNIQAAGSALSAFGSLLMFVGYEWITIASLGALAISMFFIARIDLRSRNNGRVKKTRKVHFITLFKTGYRICRTTPCIFLMLLLSQIVANCAYLDDYLSPIGVELGLPVAFVGIVQFLILGCMILGQTFAYKFTKIKDWILYASVCAGGALFILFSLHYSIAGIWALGAAYVLFSGINILLYSRFQDFLPSTYRSVILSLYSIADNVVYILVCLLMGFGGTLGSWRYSVLMLGGLLVCAGLWAILFVGNKCAIGQNPNIRVLKTKHPTGSDIV
ncbi:MAG: MFS transporter [Alphaproteobacteria bacterium]|nr:MFS transporter [Alphaproteobacteria bacterium]MDE6571076.1 MFS transporter [Alphaproteobacteria bacterium]